MRLRLRRPSKVRCGRRDIVDPYLDPLSRNVLRRLRRLDRAARTCRRRRSRCDRGHHRRAGASGVVLRGGRAGAGGGDRTPRAIDMPASSADADDGGRYDSRMADTEPSRNLSLMPRPRPTSTGGGGRWVAVLSLIIALAAVGVAAWAVVMAWPQERRHGRPDRRVEAEGMRRVRHGQQGGSAADPRRPWTGPRRADRGGKQRQAVADRRRRVPVESPGRPDAADLAEAVRLFANNLEEIGLNALAGATNDDPQQAARLTAGEDGRNKVAELCK